MPRRPLGFLGEGIVIFVLAYQSDWVLLAAFFGGHAAILAFFKTVPDTIAALQDRRRARITAKRRIELAEEAA